MPIGAAMSIDPADQVGRLGLQAQPLARVERGQLGELDPVLGRLGVGAVDAVDPHHRVELLLALALAGLAHLADDRVAAAQAVLAHHRQRQVDVVGAGQVAAGADERVVVEDVEDAGRGHQHVVLEDLGVRLAAHAAPLALARRGCGPGRGGAGCGGCRSRRRPGPPRRPGRPGCSWASWLLAVLAAVSRCGLRLVGPVPASRLAGRRSARGRASSWSVRCGAPASPCPALAERSSSAERCPWRDARSGRAALVLAPGAPRVAGARPAGAAGFAGHAPAAARPVLPGRPPLLGGLDGVDELGLLHRAGARDAHAAGHRLEVGEQHGVESTARFFEPAVSRPRARSWWSSMVSVT